MRLVTMTLGLVLALSACGGSDVSEQTPATTPPTTASPTTEPVPTSSSSIATTAPATSAGPTTSLSTTTTEPLPPLRNLRLEVVATDVRRPTLVLAPEDDSRRFIVLQGGSVVILTDDGSLLDPPFLDIGEEVNDNGIEQGLLGMAFHPDYATNGRFFVYYSVASNDTRLVEMRVGPDPDRADHASAVVLLEIAQPTDRHNAGMMQFGPDGLLYLALGEGGAASENAQNPDTVLGSILRIDVDGPSPYAIPPDNPFIDGAAPEVWAIGLRNPWRFSIDFPTETMFIGDVGHSDWEEVNAVPLAPVGYNFGWLPMEGTRCFQRGCDPTGKTLPVLEYSHEQGCSITGGFVYRGAAIPEIDGLYFYSDWCQGWIRSFRLVDGIATDEKDWTAELGSPGQVTSFGTDAQGELYVTTWDGTVYQLVADRG